MYLHKLVLHGDKLPCRTDVLAETTLYAFFVVQDQGKFVLQHSIVVMIKIQVHCMATWNKAWLHRYITGYRQIIVLAEIVGSKEKYSLAYEMRLI